MTSTPSSNGADNCALLRQLVLGALPPLSTSGRALVTSLADACYHGLYPSANYFVRSVGLSSRHALARRLAADGLPPYQVLRGWIRVLCWVLEWEQRRRRLCRQALSYEQWPRSYRRTVRSVTGLT